jgi:hypothetical protein
MSRGSFVGSMVGSMMTGNRSAGYPTSSFLEDKPGFIAKMLHNPIMGNQYRDTKVKEMFFASDAKSTLLYNYVATAAIVGVIILVCLLIFKVGIGTFIGVSIGAVVVLAIMYWFYGSYKMKDWTANKSQIESAMLAAFSNNTQKFNDEIASDTYLGKLINVSKKEGTNVAMVKLGNDIKANNNEALGVWVDYAAKSD